MQSASLGLSRFSKGVVGATLGLIFLGGMVTSLDGGLSVPDWPTTYGYNLFTFPVSEWVGLIFWEHTHRLAASLVGLLTVILAVWIWHKDRRRWVRWLGVGAVGLVVAQGIMGGLRVTELSTPLAIVHGCVAQLFLCVVTLLALALSPQWMVFSGSSRSLTIWAWMLTASVYIQLIFGAVMRHLHAGLAIPTFPLTPEGTLLPQTHNILVDIALAHRLWAAAVGIVGIMVIGKAIRFASTRFYAAGLFTLLLMQLTLGAWVIWFLRPPLATSLHVLNGAVVLMTTFVLAVRASRGVSA